MKKIKFRQHLMTAISYLIPFVAASGMLMVIGNILGGNVVEGFGPDMGISNLFSTLGATSLGFIPVVVSVGIAYSIADRPAIASGVILGLLCQVNGYGFLGGLIAGFLVGGLTVWLLKVLKLPSWLQGLLPQLILPLTVAIIIGLLMQYVIGLPITGLTNFIIKVLRNLYLNPSATILFGAVVGVLSAINYGGPINKVVFTFALGLMTEGIGGPIANLIQASMIAPFGLAIAYFISLAIKKEIFTIAEKDALKSAFIMGVFQITEGSFPIILNDLVKITLCTGVGAAVSGALIELFGVSSTVPSGGIIAMPGFNKPLLWLLALLIGSTVFAVLLVIIKDKPSENKVVDTSAPSPTETDNLDTLTFS